jgi:hypothetical protein
MKGFQMDWNAVALVVIGVMAAAAWMEARSAKRKIRMERRASLEIGCIQVGVNQAVANELDAQEAELTVETKMIRDEIGQVNARVGGAITRVTLLEEKQMILGFPVSKRVDILESRIQCLASGHLDPVCPRCNEPLVLAEPPHVTDMGDKPRRRARAIREIEHVIGDMPPGKIEEGVS